MIDDFDKRIIVGLAKGMTVKQIAENEYQLKDEGKKASLCQGVVQSKLNLMLFNYQCHTEVQLVILLVHESKLVNIETKVNDK